MRSDLKNKLVAIFRVQFIRVQLEGHNFFADLKDNPRGMNVRLEKCQGYFAFGFQST